MSNNIAGMKIAITGAHKVGKTSLAEALMEYLADYELYLEPYYELEENGYLFSETPIVDDFVMQLEHSLKQIAASGDNVIFDRCPLDFLAYVQVLDKLMITQILYRKVEKMLAQIDLLVFVPVEEPDLIPCPDYDLPELRNKVNEILYDLVRDSGVETIVVNGTLLSRKLQIINKISLA